MRGYDSYLVRVIYGQMGVDKDEEVRYGGGEGESSGKRVPCYRVGVEDDGEK